mgnify:FL=1
MPKLEIEYRTKKQDKENYFKDSTYFTFAIKDRTTLISIAPSETRNLSDIVYGIEEELQDGYHLQKDEKFEIDEEIKFIMEYEEKEDRRMDNELYPYFRFIALNRNNPEKLNQLLRYVNGGVA